VLHLTTARQRQAVATLSKMTCPEASAALGRWTPQGMVLIPAGPFTMGSTEEGSEGPVHQVWLDAFWMARHPVTNAQYAEFIEARGYGERRYWTEAGWEWKEGRTEPREWNKHKSKRDHPVRYLTWYEALAYARWQGAMLPSEAQWEKAASWDPAPPALRASPPPAGGTEGGRKRKYPWGDEFDKNKCNTSESGIGDTTPVGKYSPRGDSPYGCADMAGNVWEWTGSLHSPYPYKAEDGREDLERDGSRVLRGGSFYYDEGYARCSYRDLYAPAYVWHDDGGRVCWCAAPALPLDSGF
jgi:formylglycine-generating enzyme required for sulfatase activity